MATPIDPGEQVFLDTSYALALSAPTHQFHERALRLADELEAAKARLLTTRGVFLEIGNALAKQRYRAAAVKLLDALNADPRVEIVAVSEGSCAAALDLFRSRTDKEWGLIDCLSFVVMWDRGLTKALTADEHFQQAGFRAQRGEVAHRPLQRPDEHFQRAGFRALLREDEG